LHEGHAALIRAAREIAGQSATSSSASSSIRCSSVPAKTSRNIHAPSIEDLALCRDNGADMIFAAEGRRIVPPDRSIQLFETSLSKVLCGASRPGHFDGVCTIVTKLFNLVQPDDAVFGKKDYQQLAIIRRLVRDLDFNVVLHGIDTVREEDGLAMSSRNRYLTAEERAQAPALRAALLKAREAYLKGGVREGGALRKVILDHLATHAPLARVDYAEIVDASSLQAPSEATELLVIALAAFFGGARLIDNIELKYDGAGSPIAGLLTRCAHGSPLGQRRRQSTR
jgi:pantoate--beta-alanine ligase